MGSFCWAQEGNTKLVSGQVQGTSGVSGIHVLNTTTQKATITDAQGFFGIMAHLGDTLVFSAVQYQKRTLVLSLDLYQSKQLYIPLTEVLNELDEVILRPFDLSGDLGMDMGNMDAQPAVTAASLGLPNAYVKPPTQSERLYHEATTGGGFIPLNPVLNAITGRTKMLKERMAVDERYARTQRVKAFYPDSVFVKQLKIPKVKLDDFMYTCEVDTIFQQTVDTHDKIAIWEYMKRKSVQYRRDNGLE